MNQLKQLFTEQDFKMLNEAVDGLAKSDFGMFMMGEMLLSGLSKNEDPSVRDKEREERFERHQAERSQKEEQALELKFKLMQLKKALFNPEVLSE